MKGIAASRRGFLKFGAGAAVAGPSAAKSVLERPLTAVGLEGLSSAVGATGIGVLPSESDYDEDGEYTLSGATKRIRALVSQNSRVSKTERKVRRDVIGSDVELRIEELRIDGMRSIASSHKARMLMERYVVARVKRKQAWLTAEVDEIIEKYPALSMLIGSRDNDA